MANLTHAVTVSRLSVSRDPEQQRALKKHLPELVMLERLAENYPSRITAQVEGWVSLEDLRLPIYTLQLGNVEQHNLPTLLITGGVHGVERIGTQVILAWLHTLLERLDWDKQLAQTLDNIRLLVMPIINPIGMYKKTRSNGNGVDLNRNAPISSEDGVPILGGGHRISALFPWYRGGKHGIMEEENIILEKVLKRAVYPNKQAFSLDLHSGFGMRDRLWFPYAFRKKPIGTIESYLALKLLWEKTYPHHNYIFEPQSLHYLSHGDLWDYFYLEAKNKYQCSLMPLTLEMGSWAWVKKRPLQLFNFSGLFNPQTPHRHSRVLRRHMALLDFMCSACINSEYWLPKNKESQILKQAAKQLWFKA